MVEKPLEFPPLTLEFFQAWQWPRPPFDWPELPLLVGAAQRCRVETTRNVVVEAELLALDPLAGTVTIRLCADERTVALPLSSLRRLTLTEAQRPPVLGVGAAPKLPTTRLERDYVLQSPDPKHQPLTGRTLGHVATDEGLYLFAATDEDRALLRVFVPRTAYAEREFGPTTQEIIAKRWISEPARLLEALALQDNQPVLPIGQSLLELGLITAEELSAALIEQSKDTPLGEMLVARRLISRSDLQTALAHKMGYALVDLERFPLDPLAVRKLTLRQAMDARALPIMIAGDRLIVAVDRPGRMVKLRNLQAIAQMKVVAVLTPKGHILAALSRLSEIDVWTDQVPASLGFFPTTTT